MADPAFGMGSNALTFNTGNIQICNMTIETNPVDALVAFIFFVLLPFLQLRYSENPTPFHLHPNTIWLSILGFPFLAFFFIASSPSRLTSTLVSELITFKPSSVSLLAGAVATRRLGMLHFPYLHFMVHHSCAPRYQNPLHGNKGATSK
ncbi:hypothetical protein VNO80_00665 [Phaseolus coccineus]|uniref:Uncharacterized protein n=1 Tax=Phaseolus coccineus TaxID=3886 RepID=A0AAN9RMA7_PHACN